MANRAQRRKAAKQRRRKTHMRVPSVEGKRSPGTERILSLGGVDRRDLDAMHKVALERFGVGIGVLVQEEQRHQLLEDSLAEQRRRTSAWWHPIRSWQLRRAERRERVERQLWNTRLSDCAAAVAATADLE